LTSLQYKAKAAAITSRKHVTKHSAWQKKCCAQWQLMVSNSWSLCNIHWIYTAW